MNKKLLITILTIMLIAIFAIVIFSFVKSLDKPEINEGTQDVQNEESDDSTQTPNSTTEVPDNTTETPDNTTEKPDNSTQTPDNSTTDTSDSASKKPENNTTSEIPPQENTQKEAESTTQQPETDTKEPTKVPEVTLGYESLTILNGMSASEAYEYLNSFLNSKYSILTNKSNKVGADYVPDGLVTVSGTSYKMESTAADALTSMLAAARADGITDLQLYSGYRSYTTQKNKFDTRTQKYLNQGYSQQAAEEKAGEYIAPPGASEHHTGLAADVCSYASVAKYGYLSDTFDQTKEFAWLNTHCAEYGFILRYTREDEAITGYSYEPWHFRYIGKEHAKMCTELGLTYEEYYALLVKCRDEAKANMGA